MKKLLVTIGSVIAFGATATVALADSTLEKVKKRGVIVCGVHEGLPGFGLPDEKGNWSGLDVDFCRAYAAAIFSDPTKVKFRPLNAKDRFTALQSGEVDVLTRNTTWTMSRETTLGFLFASPTITTAKASSSEKNSTSRQRRNWTAPRSASAKEQRRS